MTKSYIKKIITGLKVHNVVFYNLIKDNMLFLLMDDTIDKILQIYYDLKTLGSIYTTYKYRLLLLIILGLVNKKLEIVSICSDALTTNPKVFREKKQYKKINYLRKKIKDISDKHNIEIDYFCILPNINPHYAIDCYAHSWVNNKIEKEGKVKCYLITELFNGEYFKILNNLNKIVDINNLHKKIDYYRNNLFIVLSFAADENFQEQQILSYTTIGIFLEKFFPNIILLDVQKKRYPFEQKFYDYGRINKLPIIFSGQDF